MFYLGFAMVIIIVIYSFTKYRQRHNTKMLTDSINHNHDHSNHFTEQAIIENTIHNNKSSMNKLQKNHQAHKKIHKHALNASQKQTINQIGKDAVEITNTLVKHGYEAYLVGGCIRDILLNNKPKDFDVVTNATPSQICEVFPKARIIGRRFKLVHIRKGYRHFIEVATFRTGLLTVDSQHHDHEPAINNLPPILANDNQYGTLDQDVTRRDFTINALYYQPKTGQIIDYYDGLDDIQTKTIQLIGNPKIRYHEDPVRMLRAIRFAAKLNFNLPKTTESFFSSMAHLLDHVSNCRLFDELLKLLQGGAGYASFYMLKQYNILPVLLPMTYDAISISDPPTKSFAQLIDITLKSTDKRINAGKTVTPAFLFAVLLWEPLQLKIKALTDQKNIGKNEQLNIVHVAQKHILNLQRQKTMIPKFLSDSIKEIWDLHHTMLFKHHPKFIIKVYNHRRFRAAYDFLQFQIEAGYKVSKPIFQWWTNFQQVSSDEQTQLINQLARKTKRNKNKSPKI